jgi:hypothetical protein
MKARFEEALKVDPQHGVLARNVRSVREWMARGQGDVGDLAMRLVASHDFELLERGAQPSLPGPLGDDFAVWAPPLPPPEKPVGAGLVAKAAKGKVSLRVSQS